MATVIIDEKVYEELLRDPKLLDALHAGGVDNWDWRDAYNEAFPEENEEE